MIHAKNGKQVRVMLTAFRDGLQSVFGGKVRTEDVIPALEASVAAGIRHFEFGGGARYQAPTSTSARTRSPARTRCVRRWARTSTCRS